jgi:hypothetical protein
MTRGKILYLTRKEVVDRGLSQMLAIPPLPPGSYPDDAGNRPIGYRLDPGFNGGSDPEAPHCASWSYGGRSPTADCIGFVLWAAGIDRCQPLYRGSRDIWLNCSSLLDDAYGTNLPKGTKPQTYVRPLALGEAPLPGDFLLDRGHISLVLRPPSRVTKALVIDCSPRHDSTRLSAISVGYPWGTQTQVIRPLFYKD